MSAHGRARAPSWPPGSPARRDAPVPASALDRALRGDVRARRPRPSLAGRRRQPLGQDRPGRRPVWCPVAVRAAVRGAPARDRSRSWRCSSVALAGAAILVGGRPPTGTRAAGPVRPGLAPSSPASCRCSRSHRAGRRAWLGRPARRAALTGSTSRTSSASTGGQSPKGGGSWRIELAGRPPRADGARPRRDRHQLRPRLRDPPAMAEPTTSSVSTTMPRCAASTGSGSPIWQPAAPRSKSDLRMVAPSTFGTRTRQCQATPRRGRAP